MDVIRGDCVAVPTDLLTRTVDRLLDQTGHLVLGEPVDPKDVAQLHREANALRRFLRREVIILAPSDWAELPDVRRARRTAIAAEVASRQPTLDAPPPRSSKPGRIRK